MSELKSEDWFVLTYKCMSIYICTCPGMYEFSATLLLWR